MNVLAKVKDVAKVVIESPKTPKALLIGGVVTIVGGTVWACVQTVKAEPILDNFKETVDNIKDMKEEGSFKAESGEIVLYDEKAYKHDLIWAYGNVVKDFAINYVGPTAVVALGTLMIGGGYKIQMRQILKLQDEVLHLKNDLAAATAYIYTTEESFRKYRENVRRDGGEELDEKYMLGTETLKDVDVDFVDPETGEIRTKHVKKFDCIQDINLIASQYAILGDRCGALTRDSNTNTLLIENINGWMERMILQRGWLSLYDVYKELAAIDNLDDKQVMMAHQCGWVLGYGDMPRIKLALKYIGSENKFPEKTILDFNCYGRITDIVGA